MSGDIVLTPFLRNFIIEALTPQFKLTDRFEKATSWIPQDDPVRTLHTVSLGTLWYLRVSDVARANGTSIENVLLMNDLVDLASRFRFEQVEPFLVGGYSDCKLIAMSIESGIDIEVLKAAETGL